MSLPALGEGKSKLFSGSFSSKERNVWFERPDFFHQWSPQFWTMRGTPILHVLMALMFLPVNLVVAFALGKNLAKGLLVGLANEDHFRALNNPVHSIPFIHSFVCSFVRSFVPSFIPSFIPSFLHSFLHSFLYSFLHSFFPSFIYKQTSPKQPPSIWAVKLIAKSWYNISESLVIQLLKSKSLIWFAALWSMQKPLYRN